MFLTKFALKAAAIFAVMGFIVSRPIVLVFLNQQSDVMDLFLWYVLFFIVLQFAFLILFGRLDVTTMRVAFGLLLVSFAFGIWLYWPASDYAIIAVGGNPGTVPSFLTASEDEVTFKALAALLGMGNLQLLGILTYVVVPTLLFLAGAIVIGPRQVRMAVRILLRGA